MKRSQLLRPVMLLTFAAILSCGSAPGSDQLKLLSGPVWMLSSMKDADVASANFMKGKPTLKFTTGLDVSGTDGCNMISGKFDLDNEKLRFGNLISTRMACPDMTSDKFSQMLSSVTHYKIMGNSLKLFSGETELMNFIAEAPMAETN